MRILRGMSIAKSSNRHALTPRLLRRERAAAYLDMSPGSFDKLVKEGRLPQPKSLEPFKAWDRFDLDALCDQLPYEGAAPRDEGPSDLDRMLGT
jgi:prophage regulatory protein